MLERDLRGFGVIFFEIQDVRDVRPTEGVNALRVVAHHAQVFMRGREQFRDFVLRFVGILVLVDEDVFEALLIQLQPLGKLGEQFDGLEQQVVEIHRVLRFQSLDIARIHLRGDVVHGAAHEFVRVFFREDHLVLGTGDAESDLRGFHFFRIELQLLKDAFDGAVLVVGVVDAEIGRETQQGRFHAQNATENGVEGAHPQARGFAADELRDPLLHLFGGLVGEGQRQDLRCVRFVRRQQMRDAEGEYARLSRARSGDDQQRTIGMHRGGPLRFVQLIEEGQDAGLILPGRFRM